jgi:hypothetical protein
MKTEKARLRFAHCLQQRDYCLWKAQTLGVLTIPKGNCLVEDTYKLRVEKNLVRFATRYDTTWTSFHDSWYTRVFDEQRPDSILYEKTLPKNFSEILIHPFSLLIWYYDDGSFRGDCDTARLATHNWTEEEVLLLQSALRRNFDLETKINRSGHSKKTGRQFWCLAFPADSFRDFRALVQLPYGSLIPSMLYKWGRPRND